MSDAMVAVVTGANRGIGLAICQLLLQRDPSICLYAASRSGQHLGFKADNNQVQYPQLDVTRQSDIDSLAKHIKDKHGKLDLLINNAGINTNPKHNPESVKLTLDTNYRGTLNMCKAFLPLLSKTGRIVNMSSVGSSLHIYSPEVQSRFRNKSMTLDELESLANEYQSIVERGQESETGFGGKGRSYSVSKACVNAMTAIMARDSPGLIINACCPGWVDTDMGSIVGKPPKSPADGAKIPVKLGTGDIEGVTGRYWANDSISSTADGKVMAW